MGDSSAGLTGVFHAVPVKWQLELEQNGFSHMYSALAGTSLHVSCKSTLPRSSAPKG